MRIRKLAGLGLVFAAALAFGAGAQTMLLRRKLIPNDTVQYKMEAAVKTSVTLPDGSPAPESEVDVTGIYTIATGSEIKDGKLPVEIKTSDMHVTSSQEGSEPGNADMKMKGLLDERGALTDVNVESSDPKTKQMGALLGTLLNGINGFPEKPVQPGDSWTITLPLSSVGMKDVQLTVKYEGVRTEDGQTFWVLHADQDVPMEIDLAAMAQAEGQPADSSTPTMTLKGNLHVTFEGLYDMDGRTYSILTENKSDMNVDGPQGGQVRIQTDQIMKLTRAKDR